MLAGDTLRLSIFLRPRTRNPAFDQFEDEPMNLNKPFFNDSRREMIWGNLSIFGSPRFRSGLPRLFGASRALQTTLTPTAMGKGGVGLCGIVRKLAEMGWNPGPMIQIIVEMPDTWKVVIGMNGD